MSLDFICYDRLVLSGGHKNYFKDWCLMNSQPTFLFLTYLKSLNYGHMIKIMYADNLELHNSLKFSFGNIRGLHLNFVDFECFLKSNSPDIFALCETNLDESIDSDNFSVTAYLPLI